MLPNNFYVKNNMTPYISNINGLKDIFTKEILFTKISELVQLTAKYCNNYMQYNEETVIKTKEIFDLLKDDYTFMINTCNDNLFIIELLEISFVHKHMLPKYKRIYGISYGDSDYLNYAQEK